MIRAISALLLTVLSITASSDPEAFSLSKFDHFVKVPYANLHAGGRLTERHIGYIAEAGYSSLLSISEFATNDTVYNGVSGSFPSSQSEVDIATSYGLSAQYTASSLTTDFLAKFVTILDSLKTPVYIHCHVGYTATLFTELYLYTKGTVKSSAEIYANGLKYGWDYQSNADVVAFVNAVTGAADTVQPESIEQTLAAGESSYKYYYWSHRAGESDLWFNQGQILDTHMPAIVTAGYKTVVSFRDNGEATNRLPGEDAAAAGASNGEFSDAATGLYNVTAESLSVAAAGLSFYHLPLVSGATQTWTVEQYTAYLPTLQAAQARGPVLAHCASGYRSSTYVLAFLAQQGKQCTAWALAQAANMGIVLDSSAQTDTDRQVIAFWQQILGC